MAVKDRLGNLMNRKENDAASTNDSRKAGIMASQPQITACLNLPSREFEEPK
jgi:hypothetical protein